MTRPVDIRFDEKFIPEPNSGCWLWTAALIPNGYGIFTPATKTKIVAHRFSYERDRGPIPAGMQIDHLCRMRCCVNPDHLEVVTNLENHRRGARATKTHCIHGHSLEDAYRYNNRSGRYCRHCQRDRSRARYQAQRTAA